MTTPEQFQYFTGATFSELFAGDITDAQYAFLLSYPSTASWSPYPNTLKYYIQDGHLEEKKVGFDRIRQKEPWKILAVLGNGLPGVMTARPPDILLSYWAETFGFTDKSMSILPHERWGHILNESPEYEKIITLFPYDLILPEKHAVLPNIHYELLSKCHLAEVCPRVPEYVVYDLKETRLDAIPFPKTFPYLIKTSHGLSGEGTYIIQNQDDFTFCMNELNTYLEVRLAESIVVMKFVPDIADNYCVQFYVSKTGLVTLIGATSQLVSPTGEHLGGVIRYEATDMTKFFDIIQRTAEYVSQKGYFGVIGVDILEDNQGQFHVIDANVRVNGSTPLCMQRNTLLAMGRETAKYSTDYGFEGDLAAVMDVYKQELSQRDFMILSALEYPPGQHPVYPDISGVRTDIYGIVTGETPEHMIGNEKQLIDKGLRIG